MHWRTCALLISALIGPLLSPPGASAQAAEEELQRGLRALAAGDHLQAVEALESSYRLKPQPVVQFNLGIAYASLDRPNHAARAFNLYLRTAPQTEAQNQQAVRTEIERIRGLHGVLEARFTPQGATVTVDGEPTPIEDGAFMVKPGEHRFLVEAEGYQPHTRAMRVPLGRFALEVTLEPIPPPIQPPVAPLAPTPPTPVAETAPTGPAPAPAAVEPVPTAGATPSSKPEPMPQAAPGTRCAVRDICMGPVLALGIPELLGAGFHLRYGDHFGIGIDYQVFPAITVQQVSVSSNLLSLTARGYPVGGSFYLGGGLGVFGLTATAVAGPPIDGEVVGEIDFAAMLFSIGFMGDSGFIMGIDLNVLLPLANKDVELTPPKGTAPEIDLVAQEIEDRADLLLSALPLIVQLNLIRVGYLF